jgi:hypothetical protein
VIQHAFVGQAEAPRAAFGQLHAEARFQAPRGGG